MRETPGFRIAAIIALTLLVASTRVHHFAALPDASWAAFFAAGFYLRNSVRWAFPWLMAVAVAVDVMVIRASGVAFMDSYCVSAGYAFLLPAYFSLWAGGAMLQSRLHRYAGTVRPLAALAVALVASVVVCHAFAQGGFYWLSDAVSAPTVAGWLANYGHWLLPYMRTAAIYIGLIALAHVALVALWQRMGSQSAARQRA
jgi:hypothetical protein